MEVGEGFGSMKYNEVSKGGGIEKPEGGLSGGVG